MSRVYFHSPTDTAELRGSERAWLRGLVNDLAVGMLGITSGGSQRVDRLKQLVSPDHYMATFAAASGWAGLYATAFCTSWEDQPPLIEFEGQRIGTFSLTLNTVLQLGNDPMRLAARIHGQCEIHAWVDGPHRAWLADIMQTGLDTGIYRHDQGWTDVINMLRARDDEPVVMSFSVTDEFPNTSLGDWMPPWPDGIPYTYAGYDQLTAEQKQERSDRQDAWYALDPAEQWRISMAGLRQSTGFLELHPDTWATVRFGHGLSVLDLVAPDFEDRLRNALHTPAEATP